MSTTNLAEHMILLSDSANEIKTLRKQNQLMKARLDMFDDMMSIIHTQVAHRSLGCMSEDLVYKIENYMRLEYLKTSQTSTNTKTNETT